jgi:hypothetical protein
MKFRIGTKFMYDEDGAAFARRMAALFRTPLFRNAVLKPRSRKLKPTRENIAKELAPGQDDDVTCLDWVVQLQEKPVAGKLTLTRNDPTTSQKFTSFLELRFSLSAGYKGGPFRNVDETRRALLACMRAGPSAIGFVEAEDEPYARSDAKFNRFRRIDDMAVPVSIEWITILHQTIVDNMGIDLRRLERVPGVQVDKSENHWSIIISSEPFNFKDTTQVAALQMVTQEMGLPQIHKRYRRSGK